MEKMRHSMSDAKVVPMRVWRPDGAPYNAKTISGDDAHYGNLVAEGQMTEAEFYPAVLRSARREIRRQTDKSEAARLRQEARDYAAGWVQRWCEFAWTRD